MKSDGQMASKTTNDQSTRTNLGEKKKKHPLDKFLAVLATLSLMINIYLIYEKLNQKAVEQPGPHVFRVLMSGFDTSLAQALVDNEDLISESFGKPRFAITEEWTRLQDTLRMLPPIRLRRETFRFLVLQNTTNSTYIGAKILANNDLLADVGSLDPNTNTFIYYLDESVLASGSVKYQVRGDNNLREMPIPQKPRDALEFLTKVSAGSIQRLGSLENVDDRVQSLIEAVGAGTSVN